MSITSGMFEEGWTKANIRTPYNKIIFKVLNCKSDVAALDGMQELADKWGAHLYAFKNLWLNGGSAWNLLKAAFLVDYYSTLLWSMCDLDQKMFRTERPIRSPSHVTHDINLEKYKSTLKTFLIEEDGVDNHYYSVLQSIPPVEHAWQRVVNIVDDLRAKIHNITNITEASKILEETIKERPYTSHLNLFGMIHTHTGLKNRTFTGTQTTKQTDYTWDCLTITLLSTCALSLCGFPEADVLFQKRPCVQGREPSHFAWATMSGKIHTRNKNKTFTTVARKPIRDKYVYNIFTKPSGFFTFDDVKKNIVNRFLNWEPPIKSDMTNKPDLIEIKVRIVIDAVLRPQILFNTYFTIDEHLMAKVLSDIGTCTHKVQKKINHKLAPRQKHIKFTKNMYVILYEFYKNNIDGTRWRYILTMVGEPVYQIVYDCVRASEEIKTLEKNKKISDAALCMFAVILELASNITSSGLNIIDMINNVYPHTPFIPALESREIISWQHVVRINSKVVTECLLGSIYSESHAQLLYHINNIYKEMYTVHKAPPNNVTKYNFRHVIDEILNQDWDNLKQQVYNEWLNSPKDTSMKTIIDTYLNANVREEIRIDIVVTFLLHQLLVKNIQHPAVSQFARLNASLQQPTITKKMKSHAQECVVCKQTVSGLKTFHLSCGHNTHLLCLQKGYVNCVKDVCTYSVLCPLCTSSTNINSLHIPDTSFHVQIKNITQLQRPTITITKTMITPITKTMITPISEINTKSTQQDKQKSGTVLGKRLHRSLIGVPVVS